MTPSRRLYTRGTTRTGQALRESGAAGARAPAQGREEPSCARSWCSTRRAARAKTTLATNLAAYYALLEYNVALVDYDMQKSALDWLDTRPEDCAYIHGVDGTRPGARLPRNMDYVFMDAPAASHGDTLVRLLRKAQTCVIPVVPSPIDLNAAVRFLDRLVRLAGCSTARSVWARWRTGCGRTRPDTRSFSDSCVPCAFQTAGACPSSRRCAARRATCTRPSRGSASGSSPPSRVYHDLELWEPLIRWLNSKRSRPE